MKVLFIGNSFTYFNDMPNTVEAMLKRTHPDVVVEKVTKGGYYLSQHLDEDDALCGLAKSKLSEKWDYVILQEQSFCPIGDNERFMRGVLGLYELIKPTGARILMYSTWAYRDGSEKLEKTGLCYEEMKDKLLSAYTEAARAVGGDIVDVGNLFYGIMKEHPECDLLKDTDNYHPSALGSLAIASLFTLTLGGKAEIVDTELPYADKVISLSKEFYEKQSI